MGEAAEQVSGVIYSKSMANIGIIGNGYVGKAVDYGFKANNSIFIHDKYQSSECMAEVVRQSDFIFVCVPTPMDKAYSQIDLSIVEEVVSEIVKLTTPSHLPTIILKSTIVPGTTRTLTEKYKYPQMLFNPEFLTEANYLEDFVHADRIVVGGDNGRIRQRLVDLYRDTFPDTPIFQTDPTTAEMVKYMANTFLATKVIFANEMYALCEKLGIKYEEAKQMVIADHRIYDSHLDVTTDRGFGGKCFPKDTVALLGLGRKLKVDMELLQTVWDKNLKIRHTRDWEEIPGAVSKTPHAPKA